jgi:hypothetical protein
VTVPVPETEDISQGPRMTRAWLAMFKDWFNRIRGISENVRIIRGTGDPESVVTGNPGDIFLRTDGGAGLTLYVKETGTGNTGWAAK